MRRVLMTASLLALALSAATRTPLHASCEGTCFDLTGEWLDDFSFTHDLVQHTDDSVTGTLTVVSDPEYPCTYSEWPIAGTGDAETGGFSYTASNPTGGVDVTPSDPCVGAITYDGALDAPRRPFESRTVSGIPRTHTENTVARSL